MFKKQEAVIKHKKLGEKQNSIWFLRDTLLKTDDKQLYRWQAIF